MTDAEKLAQLNAAMLRDPEACPTAPLTDVACSIALDYEAALARLIELLTLEGVERREDTIRIEDKRALIGGRSSREWLSPAPVFAVEPRRKGWRFARITSTTYHNGAGNPPAVHTVGFVEAGSGLMWKAATRKAPALNFPRGCIFELREGFRCVGSFDSLPRYGHAG